MGMRIKAARSLGVVGGLTAAVLLTTQGTAHAATFTSYTDPSGRGKAVWNLSTTNLTAWDTQTDGRRVVAWAWDVTSGRDYLGVVQDANGDNADPGTSISLGPMTSSRVLEFRVCTRNGTNAATDDHCKTTYFDPTP
ncbi:hypothetical protein ACWEFL_18140 [Streptomyces sp. NPDC004838]